MKKLNQLALAAVLAFTVSAGACGGDNRVTSEKVAAMIKSELAAGASSQDIELFFKKHDLPYTYDRFAKKYHSIIRDVSPERMVDQAIVINIQVDDEKKFISAEVRDSFTAP